MCMACIEAEIWAAYQAQMAKRADAVEAGPATARSDAGGPAPFVCAEADPSRSTPSASPFAESILLRPEPLEPKSE